MPNWCNNTLIITGSKDEIDQIKPLLFKDVENSKEFSFNCAVPQPNNLSHDAVSFEEMAEMRNNGIPHWYDWNNRNWGTKWDACNEYDTRVEENKIVIYFDSAWSPPTEWFYSFIGRIDPNNKAHIELKYFEIGMDFAGSYFRDSNGEMGENEGRIYNAVEGEEVFYDDKTKRYRNAKGQFVSDDELTYEVEY